MFVIYATEQGEALLELSSAYASNSWIMEGILDGEEAQPSDCVWLVPDSARDDEDED